MTSRRSRAPVEADFLVIGSGVAGLRAALELSRSGRVMVLTKGHPLQSSSIHAQGGVAVAMSEEDDVAIHLTDTLKAGHGLCRKEAVRVLVEEGPERIQELIGWGAKFDKVGGKFAFGYLSSAWHLKNPWLTASAASRRSVSAFNFASSSISV
mgnify:CR=1 FL=1